MTALNKLHSLDASAFLEDAQLRPLIIALAEKPVSEKTSTEEIFNLLKILELEAPQPQQQKGLWNTVTSSISKRVTDYRNKNRYLIVIKLVKDCAKAAFERLEKESSKLEELSKTSASLNSDVKKAKEIRTKHEELVDKIKQNQNKKSSFSITSIFRKKTPDNSIAGLRELKDQFKDLSRKIYSQGTAFAKELGQLEERLSPDIAAYDLLTKVFKEKIPEFNQTVGGFNQIEKKLNQDLHTLNRKYMTYCCDDLQDESEVETLMNQSLAKSLVTGADGTFNIFGMKVMFGDKDKEKDDKHYSELINGAGALSRVAMGVQSNKYFRLFSGGSLQVMVHEFGHATAYKLFTGLNSDISVFRNPCAGNTSYNKNEKGIHPTLEKWKESVVLYAGPMASVALSSIKLIAASALKYYCMPAAVVLATGAFLWMSGEVLYASLSAIKKDNGDFGHIRSNGTSHLFVASAALIGQCALGIFTAMAI